MIRRGEAIVTEAKVVEYLLASDHPLGHSKAVFFRSLGYTRADWVMLRDDLLTVASRGEVSGQYRTRFGTKYVVDGAIRTPVGRVVGLRTIWITDEPEGPPRLVTAYPR